MTSDYCLADWRGTHHGDNDEARDELAKIEVLAKSVSNGGELGGGALAIPESVVRTGSGDLEIAAERVD